MTASGPAKEPSVLFLLPSLAAGGAERVMVNILNHLPVAHKSLLTIDRRDTLRDFVHPGIPVATLGKSRVIHALPALIRHIRRTKPDVVIATQAHLNFMLLLLRPFLPRGTRLIVREATAPAIVVTKGRRGKYLNRFFYRYLYPTADAVVFPAAAPRDQYRALLGGKNSTNDHIIFNPVDEPAIRAAAATTAPDTRPADTRAFVCVGRLTPAKGYDRLITALASHPLPFEWRLTLLGDGPDRAMLQALIDDHGLSSHITLHGHSANPWAFVARADALLLPSRWEGMPNVVLEALALGTPVIAMREAGGAPEIAALANAVGITDTIEDFIAAMMDITPEPPADIRPSLLPDAFSLSTVTEQWMTHFDEPAPRHGPFEALAT